MDDLWDRVWLELRDALNRQPRCLDHPDFPCIHTLGRNSPNDILQGSEDGILVRSHRTNNEDLIPNSNFRAWWVHLQEHGNAALDPNHPNCPRSDRARLVGAIYVTCLTHRIVREGRDHIRLRPQSSRAETTEIVYPDEVPAGQFIEGAVRQVLVNAYERDPNARKRCIEVHGTICCICTFDFAAKHGEVAKGFIHVHHLRPLSEIGQEYVVDPVKDLRPVCPNCHAVLHRRIPAYSIEEVRAFLR